MDEQRNDDSQTAGQPRAGTGEHGRADHPGGTIERGGGAAGGAHAALDRERATTGDDAADDEVRADPSSGTRGDGSLA